ncbi:MAG: aspartate aminotransferase family protein [Planctomycetota bacterium]|jgi:4-aminobutyrate aminotransferase-like enzyme
MASYCLIPTDVPLVETQHRHICTKLPVPGSLEILRRLAAAEPASMMGQPPVVWDHAEGFSVYDAWGNRWIDWSSCVLVSNVGHGRAEIRDAVREVVDRGLLATYVFPHAQRAQLVEDLQTLAPEPADYRVFLLTTGSEAIENCIKLAKTYALTKHGPSRRYIVTFENAFHGRTMGAQLAGGVASQKDWLAGEGQTFVQVQFPDGYRNEDVSFDSFLRALESRGIGATKIASIMVESYQGGGPYFMPDEYAQRLEAFCREHDIVLACDEVQSGFGRTGRMFAHEHYGIRPDLIACGKGLTSSLPLSAVIGRADIMGLFEPGSMTATHSGSPLPVSAALASLRILRDEKLAENAATLGDLLMSELRRIQKRFPQALGWVGGRGLVAGVQVVQPGTKEPDGELALRITEACFRAGLLMFAPVGMGGACIKIAPPLVITEAALREGIAVFEEACTMVLGGAR